MTWVLVFILGAAPQTVQRAPQPTQAACFAAQAARAQAHDTVASACLAQRT